MMSVSGQFYSLVCVRDICSFFPLKIYIYSGATGTDKDFKNTTSKFCQLMYVKLTKTLIFHLFNSVEFQNKDIQFI